MTAEHNHPQICCCWKYDPDSPTDGVTPYTCPGCPQHGDLTAASARGEAARSLCCPMNGCEWSAGPLYAIDGSAIREADSHLSSLLALTEHLREEHGAVPPWEIE